MAVSTNVFVSYVVVVDRLVLNFVVRVVSIVVSVLYFVVVSIVVLTRVPPLVLKTVSYVVE